MRKKSANKAGNQLVLRIKVEPRSSKSEITGYHSEFLKVKLTSPPVDGKANRELVEIIAKKYGISKKDVEIVSGRNSKNKVVKIPGIERVKK